ncbi:MAG: type II secretion system F family protein [Bacteroidota bacterium]
MQAASVVGAVSWELLAAAGGGMVFVLFVAAGVRATLGRRDEVVERIERTAGVQPLFETPEAARSYAPLLARILRPLSALARPARGEETARLRASLIRAGYRGDHAMEIFLGVKLGATPIVTGLFLLVNSRLAQPIAFPTDAGVALVLVAVTFFLPNLWLRGRISERQTALERALPDAMDLLVTCVEGGLGLDAAIARVSEEIVLAAPVLAAELHQTFLEIHAGVQRADAFRRLADRTGVEDLRALSAMLIQTDMFGTSIARALRVHGDSMRIRRAQRAEEKAAMASVKMTIPLILCILPSLIAIVMGPAIVMIVRNFAGQ